MSVFATCYICNLNSRLNVKIAKSYLYSLSKRKAADFPLAFVPAVAGHSVALPQNEAIGLLWISPQFRPGLHPPPFRVIQLSKIIRGGYGGKAVSTSPSALRERNFLCMCDLNPYHIPVFPSSIVSFVKFLVSCVLKNSSRVEAYWIISSKRRRPAARPRCPFFISSHCSFQMFA